jgi:hypothetical protein
LGLTGFGGEHPTRRGFGCSLWFLLAHLFLCLIAAAVVGGMCLLSVRQLTVAARRGRICVPLLGAIFVQMAAPIPQVYSWPRRVAKLLTVETLRQDVVGFVSLYLDRNVAEAGKLEELRGFGGPWKGHKEQWQGDVGGTLRRASDG